MISSDDANRFEFDLWVQGRDARRPLPEDVRLACMHVIDVGLDAMSETLWFRRLQGSTELWRWSFSDFDGLYLLRSGPRDGTGVDWRDGDPRGCILVDHAPPTDDLEACLELMRARIRGAIGQEWPREFVQPGLVSECAFRAVLNRIEDELNEVIQQAEAARNSPIIQVATELKLDPEPNPYHSEYWRCQCPGTSHTMMLVTTTCCFGCGYCRTRGGPEELRAFAERRRRRTAESESETM